MGILQKIHGKAHDKVVFGRRIKVLANSIAEFLPPNAKVLDIGCGSGTLAKAVMALRPDVSFEGIDVLVRPNTDIPVKEFDGETIPYGDKAFDIALFVDVLHHTDAPERLIGEAKRVAKAGVVIKDHFRDGLFADTTLRFMPYNYLSGAEWQGIWSNRGLKVDRMVDRLGLYPLPFGWLFDRRLHFVAHLS